MKNKLIVAIAALLVVAPYVNAFADSFANSSCMFVNPATMECSSDPFGIERPEYPTEIMEMPEVLDQNSPLWLEMLEYQMVTALAERVARENALCQMDLEKGVIPCRFGEIKPSDFYIKQFRKGLEAENVSAVEAIVAPTVVEEVLVKNLRSSVCPEGKFFVADFPDGTPLCSEYSNQDDAENGRYSAALDIFQHTFALDLEIRKRGGEGFPIYEWWKDYTFPSQTGCTKTVWNAGEICQKFTNFKDAAINHYHAALHLFQLRDALKKLMNQIPCDLVGKVSDGGGGNLWKPVGDPGARCNDSRNRGGAFLLSASYDGKVNGGIEILDSNYNVIGKGFSKGLTNPNRPTWCFDRYGSEYGAGPVYVRYNVSGTQECRVVSNPANRED